MTLQSRGQYASLCASFEETSPRPNGWTMHKTLDFVTSVRRRRLRGRSISKATSVRSELDSHLRTAIPSSDRPASRDPPIHHEPSGAGSIRRGINKLSIVTRAGHCHFIQVRTGRLFDRFHGLIRLHAVQGCGVSAVSIGMASLEANKFANTHSSNKGLHSAAACGMPQGIFG